MYWLIFGMIYGSLRYELRIWKKKIGEPFIILWTENFKQQKKLFRIKTIRRRTSQYR